MASSTRRRSAGSDKRSGHGKRSSTKQNVAKLSRPRRRGEKHRVSSHLRERTRRGDTATRRQDILEAALTVFAERGFGAARLEDVASKAGVAKGTLYLYFTDKESLFEAVIRNAATPLVERLEKMASGPPIPLDAALQNISAMFEQEVLATRRKLIVRLVISEGPRFPRIAEFHYRHVVGRVLALISRIAASAHARGEIKSDAIVRYPQLVVAPFLTALIWDGLFAASKPLDVPGFLNAHRQMLLGKPRGGRA